ncbi:MAG: tetratricopeptide repeat protein [Elusimicrobia bacterium]|nr:tetratricopeptide repeat protein [Elusimicrobiota bacterium]
MIPKRRAPVPPALLAALLAAVVAAVFSPALDNGFVNWDDDANFLANPDFRGLGWSRLKWMFTTFLLGPYQPVSWLSLGADYVLWGLDPFGYHLTSIILHAANSGIFFVVALALLREIAPPQDSGPSWRIPLAAAFAALVFAVHPLRVESVAWVTERRDVLSGLFCLLSLNCYLRGLGRTSWLRRHAWALAFFAAALLSKAIVMGLPLVLLALDFYPLRRLPLEPARWWQAPARPVWLEKIPYLALAAGAAGIALLGQQRIGAVASWESWGPMPRLCYSLVFYLGKTLWPVRLIPFYEAPLPLSLWSWPYWGCAALAAALTIGSVWAWRRWPAVLVLWLTYGAALAPVAGLIKIGHPYLAAADRYTYLSCLGWALGAGWVLERLLNRDRLLVRAAGLAAAAALLAALGALTVRQIRIWKDSSSLWRAVLAVNPDSAVAHGGLGEALVSEERWEEAVLHLRSQLAGLPAETIDSQSLAAVRAKTLQNLAAARSRRERIKASPARYYNDIAVELASQGRLTEAELGLAKSLQAEPSLALTHTNLGLCLLREGRFAEAERHLRRSIRLDPRGPDAFSALAAVLAAQRRFEEAASARRQALARQSRDARQSSP